MNNKINSVLIPQINKLPEKKESGNVRSSNDTKQAEFEELLRNRVKESGPSEDIQISKHAVKRLEERNLSIDSGEYLKLKEGMKKLQNKGGKESLIITNNAAYIVDVNKNKIVTAIDKASMSDNVFTNIDSTVFMM